MIPPLKKHDVRLLRAAGHTQAAVARLTGVSIRSIRRIEQEAAMTEIPSSECHGTHSTNPSIPETPRPRRSPGRPGKASPFAAWVADTLCAEPHLQTLELLRRARALTPGYSGGKTAFFRMVKAARPSAPKPIVRFEGLPGEFTQHDFGTVEVRFVDGSRKTFKFFGSRLKYSRYVLVSLVENERTETLLRTLLSHFETLGGMPLMAVFDRPTTIALEWKKDGTITKYNPMFAACAIEVGFGVEVCHPHSPEQKGSVESLVKWVKGSFFKQRRFIDEADLRTQLAEWMREVNWERPSRATGEIPATRLAEERPRLRTLKIPADEYRLRVPVFVGPTGYVSHDGHLYSMPPETLSCSGTLHLGRTDVRIEVNGHKVEHERAFTPGEKKTLPEHRAANVAAVSGKRAKLYTKREHILEVGQAALDYLTEIVHRRPRSWAAEVEKMHEILQQHGKDAFRHGVERALAAKVYGAEYVNHFIGYEYNILQ